jgi:chromosome partitioning protein
MAGTGVRTGLAALLVCAAFAGAAAPASGQREERSRERVQPPEELLREYPFEQGRLRSRERPARRSGAGSAVSTAAGDRGGGGTVIWLALGVGALLAVLALITLSIRRLNAAGPSRWKIERPTEGMGKLVPDAEPSRPSPVSASPSPHFAPPARQERAANRYAVANQKGGVGKTTVSLVLGAAAARRGKRVLLVDLDPQASATSVLGVDTDGQPGVADVILDGSRLLPETVVPTSWGLDLVPAERRLRSVDVGTSTADESVLGWALGTFADYDLVLIDCPPSLGRLTLQALTAVSHVLVVTEPTYLALHAMEELFDTLRSVAAQQDRSIELAGVLLNRVESTAEHKRSVAELEATFGSRLWTPHIPKRAILQDAMRQGVPPQALTTHSHYASEIAEIFDQFVERLVAVKLET